MSEHSAIGWTNATWNPVTGCSRVSPGCVNCYAETLSLRMGWSKKPWTAQNAAENVKLHPERLKAPLKWREGRMVFVNSMSDLFHERVPDEFIDQVFAVMACARLSTFQVLTKRPERMLAYMQSRSRAARFWQEAARTVGYALEWRGISLVPFPLPNVWLGVSVEDQRRADERIPLLLETPAAVRFLSVEPLLERVQFPLPAQGSVFWGGIHWLIIGGESGRNHRPMDPAWAEELAAQCSAAGCAVVVKQDSGARPGQQGRLSDALWSRKEYPVGAVSPQREAPNT